MLRRLALGFLVTAVACGGGNTIKKAVPGPTATVRSARAAHLTLSSTAFSDGAPIPKQYTCDGANQSPPLSWSAAPTGSASLSLVVEDPDVPGGGFVHWTVSGIAPSVIALQAGHAPPGATEGRNGAGSVGYTGPCPPAGQTHHYLFMLKAVAGSTVLAVGELTGTYQRPGP